MWKRKELIRIFEKRRPKNLLAALRGGDFSQYKSPIKRLLNKVPRHVDANSKDFVLRWPKESHKEPLSWLIRKTESLLEKASTMDDLEKIEFFLEVHLVEIFYSGKRSLLIGWNDIPKLIKTELVWSIEASLLYSIETTNFYPHTPTDEEIQYNVMIRARDIQSVVFNVSWWIFYLQKYQDWRVYDESFLSHLKGLVFK